MITRQSGILSVINPVDTIAKRRLVRILRAAYSGENAAAMAYMAYSKHCAKPEEKQAMVDIAREELDHRHSITAMLKELGVAPNPLQEKTMPLVGRLLTKTIPVSFRSVWMAISSVAEGVTIHHYKRAAVYAELLGLKEMTERLQEMVAIEVDHAGFFRKNSRIPQPDVAYRYHPVEKDPPESL